MKMFVFKTQPFVLNYTFSVYMATVSFSLVLSKKFDVNWFSKTGYIKNSETCKQINVTFASKDGNEIYSAPGRKIPFIL
jgi:hypothetical protein